MSMAAGTVSWVVYQTPIRKKLGQSNAICEQREWDAMELAKPGFNTLIKAGIKNEGEAERLARSVPCAASVPPAGPVSSGCATDN